MVFSLIFDAVCNFVPSESIEQISSTSTSEAHRGPDDGPAAKRVLRSSLSGEV